MLLPFLSHNHVFFLDQFSPIRGKCPQGESCQVPVCGLHGHLPLANQNRRPAVWRSTGPQNVWGYRLGELLWVYPVTLCWSRILLRLKACSVRFSKNYNFNFTWLDEVMFICKLKRKTNLFECWMARIALAIWRYLRMVDNNPSMGSFTSVSVFTITSEQKGHIFIFHFTSLSLIVDQIFSISCYSVTIFFQCCIHFSPKSCTDDGSMFTCFICLIHGNYVTLPKQVNIFSSTKRCVFWNSYLRNEKLLIAKVGWTTFCRLEDNHRCSNYPIIGLYLFA